MALGSGPTSIRAVAQSFVSLLLARAGDAARTTTVANQVFATLESSPADVEVYKYLLRGVASAWALISETNTLLEPLNLIRELRRLSTAEDKVSQAQEKDGVLQEVARQLFWNGNIAESWLFGVVQVGDPTAKADFLVDEIEELRKAVIPDQMSGIVSQFAEADGAIVEEVPPYSAQRVLVSAATVLADIGEIDRARDLMKRVTGDLAQQVLAEWSAALEGIDEKIGSFIEIAKPPSGSPSGKPGSSTPNLTNSALAPSLLDSVSKELAAFIGPIAKVVVKRAAGRCSSVDELYSVVAAEIDSEKIVPASWPARSGGCDGKTFHAEDRSFLQRIWPGILVEAGPSGPRIMRLPGPPLGLARLRRFLAARSGRPLKNSCTRGLVSGRDFSRAVE